MAKKDHTAAAERKTGVTAYKLYALGALFAGLYIYFLSIPWTLEYLEEMEHVGKTSASVTAYQPDNSIGLDNPQLERYEFFIVDNLKTPTIEQVKKAKTKLHIFPKDIKYPIKGGVYIISNDTIIGAGENPRKLFPMTSIITQKDYIILTAEHLKSAEKRAKVLFPNIWPLTTMEDTRREIENLKKREEYLKSQPSFLEDFFNFNLFESDEEIKENTLTTKQIEAYKVLSLGGGILILMLYSLMGTKYGIIRKPRLIPNHYYLLSLPFFGAYIYYVNTYVSNFSAVFIIFIMLVVPYLIFISDIGMFVISEVWKEHRLYERVTKNFSGVASARWGGILTYWKFDITNIFNASRGQKIKKTKYSPIFIGKTILEHDHMIFNRFIGTRSEQHLITVAGTGAGKSRDAINANLLSYCGGIIALDIKGELTRLSYKRRSEYAPCYVVDPYNIVGDGIPTHNWNPLDEIDPESDSAKEDIEKMAEALIWKEKGSKENEHYVDIPKKLFVGFVAHVLSTFPKEKRDLPTVYDLILERTPSVQVDMLNNKAIGGAPREAALEIQGFSERAASDQGSSLMRAVKWINGTEIRKSLTGHSTFSLKDCKTKDATIFFVIREDRLHLMRRYIRLFYTLAYDRMNENVTPRQEGSERRVLMLMDEFESLDNFRIVEEGFNRGRGSTLKFWIVLQNYSQIVDNYSNPDNFTTNADMQIFGIAPTDKTLKNMIVDALGEYEDSNSKIEFDGNKTNKKLMTKDAINSFLDAGKPQQIYIPLHGDNMRLTRVDFRKLFRKKYYGGR